MLHVNIRHEQQRIESLNSVAVSDRFSQVYLYVYKDLLTYQPHCSMGPV